MSAAVLQMDSEKFVAWRENCVAEHPPIKVKQNNNNNKDTPRKLV